MNDVWVVATAGGRIIAEFATRAEALAELARRRDQAKSDAFIVGGYRSPGHIVRGDS